MKKVFILLLLFVISAGNLYAEKVIGVTAFKNLSNKKSLKWLEVGIAESISLKLRNVKEYIVIDRTNVDKVIKEIRLGQSGLIDDKSAKKAGKALNADVLVVGNFQSYGKKIRISAKIVEVESHKVLKQVQSTGVMDDIFDLQDQIALKIINESNIEISDAVRNRITKKYTKKISAYEYYAKGQDFYFKTKYTDAIKMFNKAVSIDRNYSLAYAGLAKAYASRYWQLKNYSNKIIPSLLDKSRINCEKALKLSPNLDEAHLSLGKYYQNVSKDKEKDKWNKCEKSAKKAIEINPNNGEAYFLLSRRFGYNDAKEEKYLKLALSKNDFLADAHNNLGIIYLNQKKYSMAITSFKRAIELNADYKLAYMNLGVVYSRQGKKEKALDMYKIIVEKYPNYLRGLLNLGIGYRNLKKYDKALIYCKKTVEIKPDYAKGWDEVANIYRRKGDHKKAIKHYKTALKYDYKNKYSLSNIGWCYGKIGEYNNAIGYLKKANKYHSRYAWPAGHLGWIYRYKLKNDAMALFWYTEAKKRDPNSSSYKRNIKELNKKISQ